MEVSRRPRYRRARHHLIRSAAKHMQRPPIGAFAYRHSRRPHWPGFAPPQWPRIRPALTWLPWPLGWPRKAVDRFPSGQGAGKPSMTLYGLLFRQKGHWPVGRPVLPGRSCATCRARCRRAAHMWPRRLRPRSRACLSLGLPPMTKSRDFVLTNWGCWERIWTPSSHLSWPPARP